MVKCSVEVCEQPAKLRGWCRAHYERWRRNKPVDGPLGFVRRKCGTYSGYTQHLHFKEEVCERCRQAARKKWKRDYERARGHVAERVTIAECIEDVLETWWPDRFTTQLLIARVLDLHPEWTADGVNRVLHRDMKGRINHTPPKRPGTHEPALWQARGPSWERS